jgi:hypothetical protein
MGKEKFFGLDVNLPDVFKIVPVARNGDSMDPKIATRVGLAFAEASNYEILRQRYSETINPLSSVHLEISANN